MNLRVRPYLLASRPCSDNNCTPSPPTRSSDFIPMPSTSARRRSLTISSTPPTFGMASDHLSDLAWHNQAGVEQPCRAKDARGFLEPDSLCSSGGSHPECRGRSSDSHRSSHETVRRIFTPFELSVVKCRKMAQTPGHRQSELTHRW